MKKTALYCIWVGLYVLCALFGFLPSPKGALKIVMTVLSVLFFLPPALLFWDARKDGDQKTLKLLRLLSAISLGATVVLFVINIVSMIWPEGVGNALHVLLNLVSVPMFCSGHYALSLFLWACLLLCTLHKKKISSD